MTSKADGDVAEGLQKRLRFLVKQHSELLKRRKELEKAIGGIERLIRQTLGGAESVDVPISDTSRGLFYRVQTVTTTRKLIDPRSMLEAYGPDACEAMSVIVSRADVLMKRGTQEQFDTAIQGMVEKTSQPFLHISVVRGRNGRPESAPSSTPIAAPRSSSSGANEEDVNV